MSEIKVNKLTPRTNCGTVQLGDSGDTITIPSGATITNNGTAAGFGATGAASWDTTVKTASFTGVAGVGYFVNTTSGAITVTLPASPDAGAVIAVKDYANTFDTNNVTLARNGSNIGGDALDATLSTEGLAVTLVYVDATKGWLVTDNGTQDTAPTELFITATGGTITECGNCKIHTFTGPGTFTVCSVASCSTNNIVSHLVVAGGGGGGECRAAGGGAGGFREVKNPVTPYTASPLDGYPSAPNRITVTATAFPITVGGGGAGSTDRAVNGVNGSNSVFSTITSAGGGGGAGDGSFHGADGGSGGGGANSGNPGSGNTPPVSPAQGKDGGNSTSGSVGAGGGGATVAGTTAGGTCAPGGPGGAGATTEINGSSTAFAGGGGGGGASTTPVGSIPGGTGGTGGGGDGTAPGPSTGGAGGTNTGGGGGGNGGSPGCGAGGAGGSGIVVIRYKFQ